MSEEILGCIRVMMPSFGPFAKTLCVFEDLFLTSYRVVVARRVATSDYEKRSRKRRIFDAFVTALGSRGPYPSESEKAKRTEREYLQMQEKEFLDLPLEEVLKADEHNFAIPKSDILEVELRSSPPKKHKWLENLGVSATRKLSIITDKKKYVWLLFPSLKSVKLEDCENTLQLAFSTRLSVKKQNE